MKLASRHHKGLTSFLSRKGTRPPKETKMRVLEEASEIVKRKWRTAGMGWRILLAVGITIAAVMGFVLLLVWLFVKFLKALSVGGARNLSLYFPAKRR